jgi:hypothetical protein
LPGGGSVLLGIARLARFDRRGFAAFPNSRDGFLSSLAPLLGFALVGAAVKLIGGPGREALEELAATACALLSPPVLSHAFAQAWRREAPWLLYATAFNWCQWIIPIAASLVALVAALANVLGLPGRVAGMVAISTLLSYALLLHWFLARYGLALSALRAVGVVLGTNVGTALVVLLPRLAVVMTGLDP